MGVEVLVCGHDMPVLALAAPRTITTVMGLGDLPDTTPLTNDMRRRRLDSEKTSDPIRQTTIADDMGVTSAYVSLLEGGRRKLHALPGDQLYKLLRGYRYTPSEIEGIVARYRLNVPPQLMEFRAAESGMVVILSEGGVSRVSNPVEVLVPKSALRGLDASTVRERTVQAHDLATPAAQTEAPVGTRLLVSSEAQPLDGSLVIVEQDGVQALVIWPSFAGWVTPYVPGGDLAPIELSAGRMRVAAVVISDIRDRPFKRGSQS